MKQTYLYQCENTKEIFKTVKEIALNFMVSYEKIKKDFYRNKEKIKINNYIIKRIPNITVKGIRNNQWLNKTNFYTNGKFDINKIMQDWDLYLKKWPFNEDIKDFVNYLKEQIEIYKDKTNYRLLCEKYDARLDLWECDTETTFTSDVPFDYLFKNTKKGFGNSALECIKNLHIRKEHFTKKEKEKITPNILKVLTKKGIVDWYKENPSKKPYMWAWNTLKFDEKKYHLFNYYQAVEYLDTLTKKQTHWYHNLSYDIHYIMNALIDEKGYEIIEEYNNDFELQPKKTINVFFKDKKAFSMTIRNSKGTIIVVECSYLKTTASIKDLGKILNFPKDTLNYLEPRSKNHIFNPQEKKYIRTDVEIIVKYINMVNNKFKARFNRDLKWAITIGKTALDELIRTIGKKEYETMFGRKKNKHDDIWQQHQKQYLIKGENYFTTNIFINDVKENYNKTKKKYDFEYYLDWYKKQIINWTNPFVINDKEYSYIRLFYNGGYTNYNTKYVGLLLNNIVSLDIKSSYPDKWQHYKMPYGKALYNCNCQDDLTNNSEHLKLYELEILDDIKIKKDKENLYPAKVNWINEKNKKGDLIEYYPFLLATTDKPLYVSQYMLKILQVLFNLNNKNCKITKKMCFKHKIIDGFVKYVNLWQQEKELPNLKKENPAYRDLTKLFLNSPYGKFGQKAIEDKTFLWLDEYNIIHSENKPDKPLTEQNRFSYIPVAIATTDIARLQLLSMIEEVGWNHWILSDTDSCKFVNMPDKYQPKNKPYYLNLITNKNELIYNEKGQNEFGKWELEWISGKFKCSGKKKYIYEKWEKDKWKINVVCAGATESVKNKMDFDNFFAGYHISSKDKNMGTWLNGLPVIIPATFQIKNVFKTKHIILEDYNNLLYPYYKKEIKRINKLYEENKEKYDKEITIYDFDIEDDLNLNNGNNLV